MLVDGGLELRLLPQPLPPSAHPNIPSHCSSLKLPLEVHSLKDPGLLHLISDKSHGLQIHYLRKRAGSLLGQSGAYVLRDLQTQYCNGLQVFQLFAIYDASLVNISQVDGY